MTLTRLEWIWRQAGQAFYIANLRNTASRDLHPALGFTELTRAATLHGLQFDGGVGVLFRASRSEASTGMPALSA
ncbi:hypothetical protein GCM10023166_32010 [Paeniglutamicibacter cryotolerans]|uniref:Uncharacterized protein n=1 Tax=Paeniglutamicibacter cryotolerans TaxID=670079 RepID=A0A839QR17_9MICC|nr:hypothetical protein [Paeniglutamicibacter cryotolerans]